MTKSNPPRKWSFGAPLASAARRQRDRGRASTLMGRPANSARTSTKNTPQSNAIYVYIFGLGAVTGNPRKSFPHAPRKRLSRGAAEAKRALSKMKANQCSTHSRCLRRVHCQERRMG